MEARILEHDHAGEGEPPVVLVPGGLTGWQSWLPLVPALATHRRVVRVQPIVNEEGIAGRTRHPSYEARVERESLERTLGALEIEDMHLVGWSNGGRIALDFALAHPDRVRTLTAIEPDAWWLVADTDESGRRFHQFIVGCSGREITEDDVREFLVGAGLGSRDADFRALPQWDVRPLAEPVSIRGRGGSSRPCGSHRSTSWPSTSSGRRLISPRPPARSCPPGEHRSEEPSRGPRSG